MLKLGSRPKLKWLGAAELFYKAMNPWDVLYAIGTGVSRIPWERLIHSPNHARHLDKESPTITETGEKEPPKATRALTSPQASAEEILDYQKRELYGEIWLLEGHLSNGCRIAGKLCDCCSKHALGVRKLARETQSMQQSPLWSEIASFVDEIYPKVLDSAVATGAYDTEYPEMARRLRELRKRVELPSIAPEERAKIEERAVELVKEELAKL